MGALLFNLLTGTHPFYGKNIAELRSNVKSGSYRIPRDISISLECLDFLNSCLRFDSCKRKDIDDLVYHPFISCEQDQVRESKIINKAKEYLGGVSNIQRKSLELNTRDSFNFQEIYNNFLAKKLDKRISRIKPTSP